MQTKILMIYPESPATYWSFKHILKIIGKRAAFPPLGLMTVAALLPEHYDVKLVDMNISRLQERDILDADLIFISAMIIQKESFERAVALCKNLGKTVVAGGPYPTSLYKKISGVDHFVLGEAEITLPQFISDYENGNPKEIYVTRDKPEMNVSPVPRFDLIRHAKYTTMSLQYSRGCPFNCEFCDIIELFGRVPRTKDTDQFVREMDALYATGYRGPLFIVDDNFIGNKQKVKSLLPAIAAWQNKRKYPFMLFTEASINLAQDEELMDLMVDAGFNKVFLGIETPVEESLLLSHKNQNVKIGLLDSISRIQNKGMEVTAGFILGFDSDPTNVFDMQIDFIKRSGIATAMVGLLTALPNTQLYRRLQSENRIRKETSGNNTHDFELNFEPVMEEKTLVRGYKKVISRIYQPEEYFNRCLGMMRSMPAGRFYSGAATPRMILLVIRIFLLTLVRQIFSPYGLQYLKYLARAITLHPGFFPKAIKMGLFGHHFYTITQEIIAVDDFSESIDKIRRGLRGRIEKIRSARVEDILHDLFTLDITLLEKRIVVNIQKKYKKLKHDFQSNIEESMKKLGDEFKIYGDMVAESLREKLESGLSRPRSIDELKKYCQDIKNKLKKKYRYINRDFHPFEGLFGLFENRIDTMLRDLESRYSLGE